MKKIKIAVMGAGVMGTALAFHLKGLGHKVNLWGTEFDNRVIVTRRQEKLGVSIPADIDVFRFDQIREAVEGREVLIFSIKAEGVEKLSECIASYLKEGVVILNIAKGIPDPPHLTLCDLIESNLPENLLDRVAVVGMGGAARAIEIVRGIFTEVVFASSTLKAAKMCCRIFQSPTFVTNFTSDVIGVELCAAMKNSFAIAVGIGDGLQQGSDNIKAAFMARSIIEMAKIITSKGGKIETVLGPAGVGDLYVTSQGGRNRTLGKLLGEENSVEDALKKMKGQTIEGYTTVKGIRRIADELEKDGKLKIKDDLFLFRNLYEILYEGGNARLLVQNYR